MLAVANGEIDLLGILFERHKAMLYKFFYNVNRDATLSEDMVQNVFMRILQYRERFRGDGEFRYWMFRIARNVQADHFRKHNRRPDERLVSEVS